MNNIAKYTLIAYAAALTLFAAYQTSKADRLQHTIDCSYKYDYSIDICRIGKNTLEYRIFDNCRYVGTIGENSSLDTLIMADNQ